MADFSKMKISELIAFAKEQAKLEQKEPNSIDMHQGASWAATLALLCLMKEQGVPKSLQDTEKVKPADSES